MLILWKMYFGTCRLTLMYYIAINYTICFSDIIFIMFPACHNVVSTVFLVYISVINETSVVDIYRIK